MISEEQKTNLVNKLILHLGNDGFRFINENNIIPTACKSNDKQNTVASLAINALNGIVYGPFSWSYSSSDETLKYDLNQLSSCGVVSGYKKEYAMVYISTILDTSTLSDETIIGRISIIYEKLISFQKYSVGVNNIFGDTRLVSCKTYFIFNEAYRAQNFILNISKQCKYKKGLRGVNIFPVVIDIYNKKVFEKHLFFNKFNESNLYNIF
jgi:hypothetical protein